MMSQSWREDRLAVQLGVASIRTCRVTTGGPSNPMPVLVGLSLS